MEALLCLTDLSLLHSQACSMSHRAVHIFQNQCGQHGSVRADVDIAEIFDQMRREDPAQASIVSVDAVGIEEIQSVLPADTTLVSYWHPGSLEYPGESPDEGKKNELWVFIVTRDGLEFRAYRSGVSNRFVWCRDRFRHLQGGAGRVRERQDVLLPLDAGTGPQTMPTSRPCPMRSPATWEARSGWCPVSSSRNSSMSSTGSISMKSSIHESTTP